MFTVKSAFAAAGLAMSSTPAEAAPANIVGGAATSNFPQVVLVRIYGTGGDSADCSGTLVASDWVLTAAHCVDELHGSTNLDFEVVVGDDLYDWSAETYAVDDVVYNHGFDEDCLTCGDDIAAIHLDDDVAGVAPMGISDDEFAVWIGDELTYVGFGDTYGNADQSPKKRTAEIPTTSITSELLYGEDSDDGQTVCTGDSGGAVLAEVDGGYVLVGVISFMEQEDCEGEAASTRIVAQLDWLDDENVDYSTQPTDYDDVMPASDGGWCSGLGVRHPLGFLASMQLGVVWALDRRRRPHTT